MADMTQTGKEDVTLAETTADQASLGVLHNACLSRYQARLSTEFCHSALQDSMYQEKSCEPCVHTGEPLTPVMHMWMITLCH